MMQRLVVLFRSTKVIWLILGVGAMIRVIYGLRQPVLEWDAYLYRDIAHNLVAGRGYTLDGETPNTEWAPLPTYLIAAVYSY